MDNLTYAIICSRIRLRNNLSGKKLMFFFSCFLTLKQVQSLLYPLRFEIFKFYLSLKYLQLCISLSLSYLFTYIWLWLRQLLANYAKRCKTFKDFISFCSETIFVKSTAVTLEDQLIRLFRFMTLYISNRLDPKHSNELSGRMKFLILIFYEFFPILY